MQWAGREPGEMMALVKTAIVAESASASGGGAVAGAGAAVV